MIGPGSLVRCRDAFGRWHEWVAATRPHYHHRQYDDCPLNVASHHDFEVVVVDSGSEPHRYLPWPASDVEEL